MMHRPTNEERDEALTVCAEMLLGVTRSDAEGMIEAMSDDVRYRLQLSIQGLLEQRANA